MLAGAGRANGTRGAGGGNGGRGLALRAGAVARDRTDGESVLVLSGPLSAPVVQAASPTTRQAGSTVAAARLLPRGTNRLIIPKPYSQCRLTHVTYPASRLYIRDPGVGADYKGGDVRHLYGTALAVIMTAVMFFAGAWSYVQLLKLPVPSGPATALPAGGGSLLSDSTMLFALAVLVAAAVLAGALAVVPRFSPLAVGLPGLLLVAWTVLYLVSVRRAVEFIPLRSHSFGAGWEVLLFHGILGAAGAVMIFPMFMPSRWRGPRKAVDAESASDADGNPATVPTDSRQPEEWREELPLVGTVVGGGRPIADGVRRAWRSLGAGSSASGSTRAPRRAAAGACAGGPRRA